jgi:hypothetical protein
MLRKRRLGVNQEVNIHPNGHTNNTHITKSKLRALQIGEATTAGTWNACVGTGMPEMVQEQLVQ